MSAAAATAPAADRWKGTMTAMGQEVELHVTFTATDGGHTALLDIPVQHVTGKAVSDVVRTPTRLAWRMTPPGADFDATIGADSTKAEGSVKMMGQDFPLKLQVNTSTEAPAAPKRPQTPQPPFEYTQRDVSYRNEAADVTFGGTLTIPKGTAGQKHPFVMMISGSGAHDRDETLFGHKPFLVLADHLAKHGIGSLRSDDRGVGKSTGAKMECSSKQLSGDVVAAVQFLAAQPEVDARHIGLLGQSEGGMIAAIVAGGDAPGAPQSPVSFIVSLAGCALPGGEVLRLQNVALHKAAGATDEEAAAVDAAITRVVEAIASDLPQDETKERLRTLVRAQLVVHSKSSSPEVRAQIQAMMASPEAEEATLKQMAGPWMRAFMVFDPRPCIARITVPMLAIFGELDLQVTPAEHGAAVEEALRRGGNTASTVVTLPKHNHLLQHAVTGKIDEYATNEETMSMETLTLVEGFITRVTRSSA